MTGLALIPDFCHPSRADSGIAESVANIQNSIAIPGTDRGKKCLIENTIPS